MSIIIAYVIESDLADINNENAICLRYIAAIAVLLYWIMCAARPGTPSPCRPPGRWCSSSQQHWSFRQSPTRESV